MAEIGERVREVMAAAKNVFVMGTVDAEQQPQMRWMGALVEAPDSPWTFYIVSGAAARKVSQIAGNPAVQLLFTRLPDYAEAATLWGTAEMVADPEIKQMVWEAIPGMSEYFASADDPNYGVIRFTTRCLELLAMREQHEPYHVDL